MPEPSKKTTARQRYEQRFQKLLGQLNTAQQQAVQQIEGPVLAIAGPGTGKTHMLTARIGQILLQTDTQPHNILCLTFTDAGAQAMRQRLLEFIGPEAHRVHLYTFHSFCNMVIQENLEVFGHRELESASELEQIALIRQLIDSLPVTHLFRSRRRDPYFYEKHLRNLFQQMKAEGWTADYIHHRIDAYLQDLPNQPEYVYKRNYKDKKAGDLKTNQVEKLQQRMQRLRAGADLFEPYLRLMRQRHRYDYDDMIRWVLEAFEKDTTLLRRYQEQYLYLLVDEFQDTNGSQNQLIEQLISYWESPNIFVVGDDDQSIYEFQGARVRNIVDFYKQHQADIALVLLRENYRSSQHILDFAKRLIDHNELRLIHQLDQFASLDLDKVLVARNKDWAAAPQRPIIRKYPNTAQEEVHLVQQIKALREQGIPYKEMAIIYARHKQAEKLLQLLEKQDVPYNTKRRVNILDLPIIQQLRQILQYLHREFIEPHTAERLLFEILHFDFWAIPRASIAKLSLGIAEQMRQYRSEDFQQPRWLNVIGDTEQLQKFGIEEVEAFRYVHDFVQERVGDLVNEPLPRLLEHVINRSGLLRWAVDQSERDWHLQVLHSFMDFAKEEAYKRPQLRLRSFLDTLSEMEDNRLRLSLNNTLYAEDGVHLLTAHSSKGLEFRVVFMLHATKKYWEQRQQSSRFVFKYPPSLTLSNESDAMEASRRLFYVAMTRAKEHLYLSYAEKDEQNKPLEPAVFVDELLAEHEEQAQPHQVAAEAMHQAQWLYLKETETPHTELLDEATLEGLLQSFVLSVSSMNTYINCPIGFYYQYVLRVPVLTSEEAAYGLAAHYALERAFLWVQRAESDKLPPTERFMEFFRAELNRQRAHISQRSYEQSLRLGEAQLKQYYESRQKNWALQAWIEQPFRQVEVDGVPITGIIDKVEFLDKTRVRLVDYKTGQLKKQRFNRPTPKNPEGGSYWRQLHFYRILFEQSGLTTHQAVEGQIDYLSPDEQGRFPKKTLSFEPEHVQHIRQLIKDTYTKIKTYQFSEGCGKVRCKWCQFAQREIMPKSFADREREVLDDDL